MYEPAFVVTVESTDILLEIVQIGSAMKAFVVVAAMKWMKWMNMIRLTTIIGHRIIGPV